MTGATKDDGGSAFPSHGSMGEVVQEGMSLRDWFAGQALGVMMQAQQREIEKLQREYKRLCSDNRIIGSERSAQIEFMHAALDAADAVAWRPIETAPKDGTIVLLFARAVKATAMVTIIGWYFSSEEKWIELCFYPNPPVGIMPSAWMPLPAPPKDAP